MPRQIREILASVRETGDRGRNTGAPGKYGRSDNPTLGSQKKNITESVGTRIRKYLPLFFLTPKPILAGNNGWNLT